MRQCVAPATEAELVARAREIAGMTLGQLALRVGATLPATTERAKGAVGELLERALGASAGARDVPDFVELGIELKTIPVDRDGRPRESTFVCSMPVDGGIESHWRESRVHRKLARVLFVPIESDATVALDQRRVGAPLLWAPSADEEAALRRDWEALRDLVAGGHGEAITAHLGEHLQVRPKARDSHVQTLTLDAEGEPVLLGPRGFYLRTSFTRGILERGLSIGAGAAARS